MLQRNASPSPQLPQPPTGGACSAACAAPSVSAYPHVQFLQALRFVGPHSDSRAAALGTRVSCASWSSSASSSIRSASPSGSDADSPAVQEGFSPVTCVQTLVAGPLGGNV